MQTYIINNFENLLILTPTKIESIEIILCGIEVIVTIEVILQTARMM